MSHENQNHSLFSVDASPFRNTLYKANQDSVSVWWTPSYSLTYTLGKDGATLLENGKPTFRIQPATE